MRQRCVVCGKFHNDVWGCAHLTEWRSCCEPPAVACKRKPERRDISSPVENKPKRRDESPIESECEPEYQDELFIEGECESDLTEYEDDCEADCCAYPWVYEQDCFIPAREESFAEEAALECAPNFTGLLSDELPKDPH